MLIAVKLFPSIVVELRRDWKEGRVLALKSDADDEGCRGFQRMSNTTTASVLR